MGAQEMAPTEQDLVKLQREVQEIRERERQEVMQDDGTERPDADDAGPSVSTSPA